MISPEALTRTLADTTRLRILMLLLHQEELCVCHLTEVLDMVQPKVSRHLAVLRENKLLLDRRSGLWIHYKIHPELPDWCYKTLQAISEGCTNKEPFDTDQQRLARLDTCTPRNNTTSPL